MSFITMQTCSWLLHDYIAYGRSDKCVDAAHDCWPWSGCPAGLTCAVAVLHRDLAPTHLARPHCDKPYGGRGWEPGSTWPGAKHSAQRLPRHTSSQGIVCAREPEGKIHRVDPDFGSTLTDYNRNSQSNRWVNWKIMGQLCKFSGSGDACGGLAE